MRINYARALVWVRWAAIALAGFVITTVTGGFILQLCESADWYKNAWHTVAGVIAIVRWIIGSPIFHWLGGGALGFALGIWIDDLLRRLATKPQLPPTISNAERGFLDYQMDIQTSVREMTRVLGKVGGETVWIGKKVDKQTPKIMRLVQRAQADVSERLVRRAVAITNEMSSYYDKYCSRIVDANQQFTIIATTMITAIQWMIENQPNWRNEKSLSEIRAMRDGCLFAKGALQTYTQALVGNRGVSATLTESVDRAIHLIVSFTETVGRLESFCTSVLHQPTESQPAPLTLQATTATLSPQLPPDTGS